jgi:hypothetical protein
MAQNSKYNSYTLWQQNRDTNIKQSQATFSEFPHF